MRIGNRHRRGVDHLSRRLRPYMAEITQHSDSVHLGHDLAPEIRQAAVAAFIAAAADPVLGIVRHLRDADTKGLEDLDIADPVFESRGVLHAQNDRRLSRSLRAANIRNAFRLDDMVAKFTKPAVPLHDIVDGIAEILPDAAGAVRGRQPRLLHFSEQIPAPFRDDETVDDDCILIDRAGLVFMTFSISIRYDDRAASLFGQPKERVQSVRTQETSKRHSAAPMAAHCTSRQVIACGSMPRMAQTNCMAPIRKPRTYSRWARPPALPTRAHRSNPSA